MLGLSVQQQRLAVIAEARRELDELNAELPAVFDAEIRARLRGGTGIVGRSSKKGVPSGSDAERLMPALEIWRHSTLEASEFAKLRERLLRIFAGHHREVLEALNDPGGEESALIFQRHGLPADPSDAQRKALTLEVLGRLEKVERATEPNASCLDDPAKVRMSTMLRHLINLKLAEMLREGRIEVAHEMFALFAEDREKTSVAKTYRDAGFDRQLWRQFAALAQMDHRARGKRPRDWVMRVQSQNAIDAVLMPLMGSRLHGDKAEIALAKAGHLDLPHKLPVCEDSDSALAQARALLRNPFGSRRYREIAGRDENGTRPVVTVAVTAEAFSRLAGDLRDGPAWREMRVMRLDRGGANSLPGPEPDLGIPSTAGTPYGVRMRLELEEDGRQAQVNFVCALGAIQTDRYQVFQPQLEKLIMDNLGEQTAAEIDHTNGAWKWSGASIESGQLAAGTDVRPTPGAILGPDSCDHPGAAWSPASPPLHMATDSLVLSCPRCLRQRVTSIPLHRLPKRHPETTIITGGGTRPYLEQEKANSLLAGKPVLRSIAALRTRDGIASLEPSDYAIRGPSQGAAVSSVAAAMSRR